MFVCLAIYNDPSHFTRVLLNRSIQNIETRACDDACNVTVLSVDDGRPVGGTTHYRQLNITVRLEILKPN